MHCVNPICFGGAVGGITEGPVVSVTVGYIVSVEEDDVFVAGEFGDLFLEVLKEFYLTGTTHGTPSHFI